MKNVIKKRIYLALTLLVMAALVFSMVACSNGSSESGQTGDIKSESQIEDNGKDEGSAGGDGGDAIITLWTFADTHHRFFEYVRERFAESHPNVTVNLELYDFEAMADKLTIIMASGGDGAPDMADIEQGGFGRFIKGSDVIFEPLNAYLEESGNTNAITEGRQALYTWEGQIYGLEHALCPVTMLYRKDIFEEKGIEVPIKTWDDFREAGKKLDEGQYMIGIPASPDRSGTVDMLYKSGNDDIVTTEGEPNINNQRYQNLVQMLWDFIYTDEIATTYEVDQDLWNLINDDKIVTYINADWGAGWVKDNCPDLSGKWGMTQLPIMQEGDVPTSVAGGTGLTMLAVSEYKDLCWEFMQLAQLDVDSAVKRYELTTLFPPLIEAFDDERLYEPDPYFDGFEPASLYRELGEVAPVQRPTWWRHLYSQAFEKFFFDMEEGKITAEEFAQKVEDETEVLIEENE